MKNTLNTLVVAGLFISSLGLSACTTSRTTGFRTGFSKAGQIARNPNLPGKREVGQCLSFAFALHEEFKKAGIPSKVIVYGYRTINMPVDLMAGGDARKSGIRAGTTGSHAIVAYEDEGRTYVMDNQSWMPVWVPKDTNAGLAERFSGTGIAVDDARTVERKDYASCKTAASLPR